MARAIRGRKYRSKLEAFVARRAQQAKIKFEYEPFKIPWVEPAKKRNYLPDMVLDNNIIIEIKGRLTVEDRRKMLQVKKQYPELDIRFVFKVDNWLTKAHKVRYSQWCKKNGFKYAIGGIPKEWTKEPKKELPKELAGHTTG